MPDLHQCCEVGGNMARRPRINSAYRKPLSFGHQFFSYQETMQ